MKLAQQTNYVGKDNFDMDLFIRNLLADLKNLFLCLQGRVRFGSGTSGANGENIYGQWAVFTSSNSVLATNTIVHSMSATPIGWITVSNDKGGVLYLSSANNADIRLISTTTSTTYMIFLLK
jgi:hypothetical protein